jgi:LuxR family maltose regulon positive regulatory protein
VQEDHLQHTTDVDIILSTELRTPLLAPKLRPPHPRSSLVIRERLLAQLDASQELKLTLLSAPAGFGKTTLVSQWVSVQGKQSPSQPQPHRSPVAWVALEPADNDLIRFWRYVMTACVAFQADAPFAQFLAPQSRPFTRRSLEMLLATFVNELASLAYGGILVLEDYHVIHVPAIHEMMTFLIDHLPPTLHIILITRTDPPLPLARWRARDELHEVHAADLRFSDEEASTFLQQTLPLPLSSEALQRLEAHTEGWPAGLRLVTLALHGRTSTQEIERFLMTFTGGHRHILEYLVTEVLSTQPEPLQQFLLQTTILPRLTAPLCDALTGKDDSARLLEQLERANLFLVPLDESGQWYRYHALFAEAMQHEACRRLGEETLLALHARASTWYEQRGMLNDAVEAAFSARQFTRVITLIGGVLGPEHFTRLQEYYTLRRWLEQLPEEVLATFPDLCFMYANMLVFVPDQSSPNQSDQFEKPLRAAERAWQAEGNRAKLSMVMALRALLAKMQGNTSLSLTLAQEALEHLPEDAVPWRSISMGVKGSAELQAGQLYTAQQTLQSAYALSEQAANKHAARANMIMLADTYRGQGRLHQANESYRQALATAEKDPGDKGAALLGLAQLAYEWNDLEMAERQAGETLAINEQLADEELQIHASLVLIRVLHARQQTDEARQLLTSLLERLLSYKPPALYREVLAQQARLQLDAGDFAAVQRWLPLYALRPGDALPRPQQEQEALLQARLLIAQGEHEQACKLLARWQREAHEAGRLYHELEMSILTSLAFFHDKQFTKARQLLREVLTSACIEGYQRLFLDEGDALAALLRATLTDLTDDVSALYARMLLQTLTRTQPEQVNAPAVPSPVSGELLEPLSPQEQNVLRLLVAGRSNPEIAGELIVSINTVKAHVKSIYRKLDVHNRVEASEVARHLKLL